MTYLLEVDINAEGQKLACIGKGTKEGYTDGGCYRIAGQKAWGGSRNIARLEISESDLVEFIKSYAPEIIPQLVAPNEKVSGTP
jgi:hypothetical protein